MITIQMPYLLRNSSELQISNVSLSPEMITILHDFLNDMYGNWLYSIEKFLYRVKDEEKVPAQKVEQYFLNHQKALEQVKLLKKWGTGIAEMEIRSITALDYISLCKIFYQLREAIVYDECSLHALSGDEVGQHRVSIVLANGKMFTWLDKFREEFFTPMANEIKMKVREEKGNDELLQQPRSSAANSRNYQ